MHPAAEDDMSDGEANHKLEFEAAKQRNGKQPLGPNIKKVKYFQFIETLNDTRDWGAHVSHGVLPHSVSAKCQFNLN